MSLFDYISPFTCLPVWLVSGSLDVSLYLFPFICLPLCLMVSGSPDVFSLLSLVPHRLSLAMCLPIYPAPK